MAKSNIDETDWRPEDSEIGMVIEANTGPPLTRNKTMTWSIERNVSLEDWKKLNNEVVDVYERVKYLREGLQQMACAESEVVRDHALKIIKSDDNLRDR